MPKITTVKILLLILFATPTHLLAIREFTKCFGPLKSLIGTNELPTHAVRERLAKELPEFRRKLKPRSELVPFGGTEYSSVAILHRDGTTSGEGVVYLVRDGEELATIKKFYSPENAVKTETEFKALFDRGRPVAKCLGRDGDKLKFEYIEGYTLLELRDLKEAGTLTEAELKSLVNQYEDEILSFESEVHAASFHSANVVYSPAKGQFIVVDLR